MSYADAWFTEHWPKLKAADQDENSRDVRFIFMSDDRRAKTIFKQRLEVLGVPPDRMKFTKNEYIFPRMETYTEKNIYARSRGPMYQITSLVHSYFFKHK